MLDVFITMKEAAEFEGVKYGTFAQRIARNPKQYKTRTQPQENGGKEQVLVSVDSLTAKGRKAWRAAQKIDGRDVVIEKRTESAPWYVGVDLNHYTRRRSTRPSSWRRGCKTSSTTTAPTARPTPSGTRWAWE